MFISNNYDNLNAKEKAQVDEHEVPIDECMRNVWIYNNAFKRAKKTLEVAKEEKTSMGLGFDGIKRDFNLDENMSEAEVKKYLEEELDSWRELFKKEMRAERQIYRKAQKRYREYVSGDFQKIFNNILENLDNITAQDIAAEIEFSINHAEFLNMLEDSGIRVSKFHKTEEAIARDYIKNNIEADLYELNKNRTLYTEDELNQVESVLQNKMQKLGYDSAESKYKFIRRERTISLAEDTADILEMPTSQLIPTVKGYENMLNPSEDNNKQLAYLYPNTLPTDNSAGNMFKILDNYQLQIAENITFKDAITGEKIIYQADEQSYLKAISSFIYSDLVKKSKKMTAEEFAKYCKKTGNFYAFNIYLPDLYKFMGKTMHYTKEEADKTINILKNMGKAIGVLKEETTTASPMYMKILDVIAYNPKFNIITVVAPYIEYAVKDMLNKTVLLDKKGNFCLDELDIPKKRASFSYLIRPTLHNAGQGSKDKKLFHETCAINVEYIIKVIEQTGSRGTPHFTIKTLLENNLLFKDGYTNSSNQFRYLKRVGELTWILLKEETYLEERYKNIMLPKPTDTEYEFTKKNLDKEFKINHEGKINKNEK